MNGHAGGLGEPAPGVTGPAAGNMGMRELPAPGTMAAHRGDLVRRSVADLREKRYRAEGKDCYLFNVDDALVIDATMSGNWARFTVSAHGGRHGLHFCTGVHALTRGRMHLAHAPAWPARPERSCRAPAAAAVPEHPHADARNRPRRTTAATPPRTPRF